MLGLLRLRYKGKKYKAVEIKCPYCKSTYTEIYPIKLFICGKCGKMSRIDTTKYFGDGDDVTQMAPVTEWERIRTIAALASVFGDSND